MISFIRYKLKVPADSLNQLRSIMDQYEWMSEYILIDEDESGNIALFDIRDGTLKDAVEEVFGCFDDTVKKDIVIDIVACDSNEILRFYTEDGVLKNASAVDFIWA